MRRLSVDVVVIGGGTTGVGVVRDLALRGYRAALLDRADLAQGTSGRFHGLLHSGGRYVVTDSLSATECAQENVILRRIQAPAIEETGGLFVTLPDDPDPTWADQFVAGAARSQVPLREIDPAQALKLEPRLNPAVERAFLVEDAAVDGWRLAWGCAQSAREHGAQILTYTAATAILRRDGRVTGVRALDRKADQRLEIECGFVLNCAGPWAGRVAALAECRPVAVVPGRGIMIAVNRFTRLCLNRCVKPADGDLIVPAHGVSIIGTTDVKVDDPDRLDIPRAEVQQMFDAAEKLTPGFRRARPLHAWAGARPLIKDDRVQATDTRHMSRGMAVIDHADRDGLAGLLTIGGGKLTTYRLMAEHIVDAMEAQSGDHHPCRTADEPCPDPVPGARWRLAGPLTAGATDSDSDPFHSDHPLLDLDQADRSPLDPDRDGPDLDSPAAGSRSFASLHQRLRQGEDDRFQDQLICECELVSRRQLLAALRDDPQASLDDLRRQLRLGMGPCQGGFCAPRAVAAACQAGVIEAQRANGLLRLFLTNRWYGLRPILHGQQVAQAALDNWIWQGTLNVAHLPEGGEAL
ncbi:MAG: FAD-dependent oxidoreductase [Propionibacteriaceae bacterium]|jgi:glycerol-3-phosphate dehydrogenase|nr:FAD-dependent oxidoreductase [Propionibacteriaceae bacterium]